MKKFGFTLAEVLITLGIIGVVAAITMPTLIQNYQKEAYVNRLKKAVSVIENMQTKIMADEEVTNFSDTKLVKEGFNFDCIASDGDRNVCAEDLYNNKFEDGYSNPSVILSELTKHFNVLKTCMNSECNILYQNTELSNGKLVNIGTPQFVANMYNGLYDNDSLVGIYTVDGFIFYFLNGSDSAYYGPYMRVFIDVNGTKGPNQKGRDLYVYYLSIKGKNYFADEYGDKIQKNGWKMDY